MTLLAILALLFAPVSSAEPRPPQSVGPLAQDSVTVTAQDIEHFMNVAFGDFAVQGKRRLAAWHDSAAVRLSREVVDADRQLVSAVIAEINQHAGRTIYYMLDAAPDVEVSMVSSDIFPSLAQPQFQASPAVIRSFRVRPTGYIASAHIIARNDRSVQVKTDVMRLLLAKTMGMMYLSTDGRRTIFHGTKPSRGFEAVDKIALRLMADHNSYAGSSADQVRKMLVAKYVTAKAP